MNLDVAFLIQTNIVITYYLDIDSYFLHIFKSHHQDRLHWGVPIVILYCHLKQV